jgi:cytochrome c-type biogenesis protein
VEDLFPQVSWLAAFAAGLVSFFSPCVAPLVPGYLSFISGVSAQDLRSGKPGISNRIALSALLFVLGFASVFVLLGASASLAGGLLEEYRRPLNRISGIVMIAMGLVVIGLLRAPIFYRDFRVQLPAHHLGPAAPVLLGGAFAFGWTPCVGPILASILFYASASQTVLSGALLLLVYSLGLGVPFLLAGMAFGKAMSAANFMRRHHVAINAVSGGLLVAVGVLFLTEKFFYLNIWMQRMYYTFFPSAFL